MARPRGGYKLANGDRVPGVTTITGRFKDSGALMHWAFQQGANGAESLYDSRNEAADIGTFVHGRWEAMLSDSPQPDYPKEFTSEMRLQADTSLEAAIRWYEDSRLKISVFERPLVSEVHRYAGTPDGIAVGSRGGALVDWKTGAGIYPETWMQLSAYVQLLKECCKEIDISDGVHIVRFGKTGGEFSHLHIPLEHFGLLIAWEQFKAFIGCYERDKMLRKMI